MMTQSQSFHLIFGNRQGEAEMRHYRRIKNDKAVKRHNKHKNKISELVISMDYSIEITA
jgi:hypothetical protein